MASSAHFLQTIHYSKAFRDGATCEQMQANLFRQLQENSLQILGNLLKNHSNLKSQITQMIEEVKKLQSVDEMKKTLTLLQDVSKDVDESLHQTQEETNKAIEKLKKQQKLKECSFKVLEASKEALESSMSNSREEAFVNAIGTFASHSKI